jgi:hypothetical protein
MQKQLKPLSAIPFVVCLLLLIGNDFYLKATFHNFFTGKLSDFCGLFVFSVFFATLFPGRKLLVFFSTALCFIYWKSPYSESFINAFSVHLFSIHRIVDITDLFALLVLPVAWYTMEMPLKRIDVHPWFISVVCLFSFCATTMPHAMQGFEQPQYVLFKGVSKVVDSNRYNDDLKIYPFDTLTVVGVGSVHIGKEPVKSDDFQKTLVLKDLDLLVQNELGNDHSYTKAQGSHSLQIRGDGYVDEVTFKGSRLDGKITRKSSTGEILIEGQYKDGIEDATWTVREPGSLMLVKKTFKNGEKVLVERYQSDQLRSSESVRTRSGTVNFKYFQILFLLVASVWMIVLIRKNYKEIYPGEAKIMLWQKILLCFSLPIVVIFFNFILVAVLIYAYTLPIFFLVLFGFKIRKSIDVLWYCLLFALCYHVFWEVIQLQYLKAGTEVSKQD